MPYLFCILHPMWITLAVLGISVVLFVKGKVRADMVALCGLVVLMVADVLTPDEALSGFSNSVVVMMVGLFIVGGAILQTGLADVLSKKMVGLAGTDTIKIYLLVMLATSAIGGFVSNTGTVALMLPIVTSLAMSTKISASRLLMPMAFASSMGGMMTLIGTPPNLIISTELEKAGYGPLSFFSFAKVGGVIVVIGMVVLWFLSKKFLDKKPEKASKGTQFKSLLDLVKEYHLNENLYLLKVNRNSTLTNKRIRDLDIGRVFRVVILEIDKKKERLRPFSKQVEQILASPDTIIQSGDILYVSGSEEDVHEFAKINQLKFIDNDAERIDNKSEGVFSFDKIGLAELVVLSNSRIVNQEVRSTGLRENYNISVVGIQRNNKYMLRDLQDEKIHAGDALLIHGKWDDIARLNAQMLGLVVLGQPLQEASKVKIDHKAPLAALIMIGMVALMVFNIMPAVTAVMLAAILMVVTGCLRNVEAAFQTINWESILLIGAMLPMSLALEKTGVSQLVSEALVGGLGELGPIYLLGGVYLATSTLTMFINNTATAVLFAPIAMQAAQSMNVSPYPFLFAVTVAASMCFASPFSTPPNALVMSAGRYTFMDYVKVGLPLQLLLFLIMILFLPYVFPF